MKKLLLAILIILPITVTWAVGEKTFDVTPTAEYMDDTPMPQAMIASYEIECDGVPLVTIPNTPLDTDSYIAPAGTFPVGDHSCVAYTVTTDGERSGPSNVVNFTVVPGVPKPPILAVQ